MTLLLLAAVGSGGYLAWIWVPLYFDHYTVKQVVADYMNQAVKNRDDAQLRRDMVAKIQAVVQVETVDQRGKIVRVPAIPLDERNVTWERDDEAKVLHVAFEYDREVVYPFLNRSTVKTFTLDKNNDLTIPDWGPAR